jgi:ribosome-binding factor A
VTTHRAARMADEIRQEIARLIGSQMKDPRVGFVTVTRVELSHDLTFARVLVSVLGNDEERKQTMRALEKAAGFFRRGIARAIRMRQAPEIVFKYDHGLDAAERVAAILEEVKQQDRSDAEIKAEAGEDDGVERDGE